MDRVHRCCISQDEVRQTIELSKFGFLQDGILSVNFFDMVIKDDLQSKDVLVSMISYSLIAPLFNFAIKHFVII